MRALVLLLALGACHQRTTREQQSEAYDRAWVQIHKEKPTSKGRLVAIMGQPTECGELGCTWTFLTNDGVKSIGAAGSGDAVLFIDFGKGDTVSGFDAGS